MAYLEKSQGKEAGKYSAELLAIDANSGPWLVESQRSSIVAKRNFPRFDVDFDEGVIWFGDDERNGIVARVHTIGSYSTDDGAWVWAWTSEKLAELSVVPKQMADEHEDVHEFGISLIPGTELTAWTLAASIAYLMKAEACFRLPGDLQMFIALTDIDEIAPTDPRARRLSRDPEAAEQALKEFVGPAALRIGAALVEELGKETPALDTIVAVLHRVCERLDELSRSPVGSGTPAAEKAAGLAGRLRQSALSLSLPPGHPNLAGAAQQVLQALEAIAREHEAWPTEPAGDA